MTSTTNIQDEDQLKDQIKEETQKAHEDYLAKLNSIKADIREKIRNGKDSESDRDEK